MKTVNKNLNLYVLAFTFSVAIVSFNSCSSDDLHRLVSAPGLVITNHHDSPKTTNRVVKR